jgi:membrane protein required for beta-lactamase induction
MADITNGWKPIAIMCGGSFVIALIYVFLLRWIVKPILYLSMFIILFVFIALGAWCFMHSKELEKTPKGKDSDEYKYN